MAKGRLKKPQGALIAADDPAQFDGSTHMVSGGDVVALSDGHNQILMSNEDDGLGQLDDNTHMAIEDEGITQPGGHNQMATEASMYIFN
ncbi:hypothetical protein E2562_013764 [Oryza meyeriana var. granulata]|uniref:Uncharacterized protein n=1 Tax=Oryza meyeriana var. granulata TaxID=110450 RepID=A0A6G1F827_9ORYZ|nr:hypothetical protein E2562_013764 [Oryza meyeriana var. granulata]